MFDEKHDQGRSIGASAVFVVSRSWGQIGSAGQYAIEEYYSDQAVVKEFRQILKKRDSNGYYIVESNIGNSFEEILQYLEKRIHAGIIDN